MTMPKYTFLVFTQKVEHNRFFPRLKTIFRKTLYSRMLMVRKKTILAGPIMLSCKTFVSYYTTNSKTFYFLGIILSFREKNFYGFFHPICGKKKKGNFYSNLIFLLHIAAHIGLAKFSKSDQTFHKKIDRKLRK